MDKQQSKLNEYLPENPMVPSEVLQIALMSDFFAETEHFKFMYEWKKNIEAAFPEALPGISALH
mgnify:CR=1 FL=1